MAQGGLWVAKDGVWKRSGRPDRPAGAGTAFTRPTGPGYYAIENLSKPLTHAGIVAASAQVKGLATGVDDGSFGPAGRVHRTLTVPAMTISCPGFGMSANDTGLLVDEGVGLVGASPDSTFIEVAPDSITQAQVDAWYPADVYPSTIGLKVFTAPNGRANRAGSLASPMFAQFTVRGTQQRVGGTQYPATANGTGWNTYHYNGISSSRTDAEIWQDVKVTGIPGFKNSPPGETFGFTKYLGSAATFRRLEVDGRIDGTGTRVGAAGIATNTTDNIRLEGCYSHHMGFSHGYAFWETNIIRGYDCIGTNNGQVDSQALNGVAGDGFNFERCRDTALYRPTVGFNTLAEMRYYNRNDGDSYDGNTFPHYVEDLTLLEGNLDIWIDSGGTPGSVQTTQPTLVRSPAGVFTIH